MAAPYTEPMDFTLTVARINDDVDEFVRLLNQYIRERVAAGANRADVLNELDADFKNRGAIYQRLSGNIARTFSFGANTVFQRASNPPPPQSESDTKFKWTLNPDAEHCDSCLYQESQPARTFDEIPLPTQQPTHGSSNCKEYCKCTLTPTGDAGGVGQGAAKGSPSGVPTPAPSAPSNPQRPTG